MLRIVRCESYGRSHGMPNIKGLSRDPRRFVLLGRDCTGAGIILSEEGWFVTLSVILSLPIFPRAFLGI